MKTYSRLAILALLFAVTVVPCFALIQIEPVTRERAKALGMEIRYNAAGSGPLRVELEFKATGELKNYDRVDLEFASDGNWILSSTLKEEGTKPGVILVSFAVDRASLDKITLRVVSRSGGRAMSGFEIRVKDFVELEKGR